MFGFVFCIIEMKCFYDSKKFTNSPVSICHFDLLSIDVRTVFPPLSQIERKSTTWLSTITLWLWCWLSWKGSKLSKKNQRDELLFSYNSESCGASWILFGAANKFRLMACVYFFLSSHQYSSWKIIASLWLLLFFSVCFLKLVSNFHTLNFDCLSHA